MEENTEIVQEIIYYEPGSLFKFYNNYEPEGYRAHHHNAVEIIMPVRFDYNVEISRQLYTLKPDDILIIPPGEIHRIDEPTVKGQRIILQFDTEILSGIHGFTDASDIYSATRLITEKDDPQLHDPVKTLLLEMLGEYLGRHAHYEAVMTHKITGISLHLIRMFQRGLDIKHENLSKHKMPEERLNECLDYINRSYTGKLTLEDAAQAIGFSKFHFSRWFLENAGISFHDYLNKIRIEKTKTMLRGSTMSITEIAMESGFQNTNTFNRMFKKLVKCTPTEYRHLNFKLPVISEKRTEYSGFSAAYLNSQDWFAVSGIDFGSGNDEPCFYARAVSDADGEFEIRLGSLTGDVIGTLKSGKECDGRKLRSSAVTGIHTLFFILKKGSNPGKYKLDIWKYIT